MPPGTPPAVHKRALADIPVVVARDDAPAKARGVATERVEAIIRQYTEGPELGIFGELRVNVLEANLALDRTFGVPAVAAGAASPAK